MELTVKISVADSSFAKGESSRGRQVADGRCNPKDVKTDNIPTEAMKGPLTSESEGRNNDASTRPKEGLHIILEMLAMLRKGIILFALMEPQNGSYTYPWKTRFIDFIPYKHT